MNGLEVQGVTISKKGISGSTLKIIALVTMLIDHFGAIILGRMMDQRGIYEILNSADATTVLKWMGEYGGLFLVYTILRFIGRVAFPIFIFLMVEGFARTRNKWKYLLRMLLFAVLSEIPFDLALRNQVLEFTYQNIFFTLAIGLLAMIICEYIEKHVWSKNTIGSKLLAVIFTAAVIVAAMVLAEVIASDYGWSGIACIMAIFLFRKNKVFQIVAGCIAFIWEFTAPLAFIPIAFYNGKRGLKLKYFFYAFYPVHLLILYVISVLCGLGAYVAV